jgi:CheY-like chemotaxis protein
MTGPLPDRRKIQRVARILLADDDLASRLALKTLLSTAGYAVDGAASAAEAAARLDSEEYQLVLADLRAESDEAGPRLLAFARQKEYRPATALISSELSGCEKGKPAESAIESVVRVSDDTISHLLAGVAELIGSRADRRMQLALRRAS